MQKLGQTQSESRNIARVINAALEEILYVHLRNYTIFNPSKLECAGIVQNTRMGMNNP